MSRIRVEPFDRPVRVTVDGELVAQSDDALVLHETGLPRRYYVPRRDIRMERLQPSDKQTHCPWKGDASYFDVGDRRDAAWSYERPDQEDALAIAGYVSFKGRGVTVDAG